MSATHVRGETLVVTAHGNAWPLDIEGADADFGEFLRGHYGEEPYEAFLAGSPYYGVDTEWLFAADMSVHSKTSAEGG